MAQPREPAALRVPPALHKQSKVLTDHKVRPGKHAGGDRNDLQEGLTSPGLPYLMERF